MTEKLMEMEEVLFRQVHPNFVEDDGFPSSQPFAPTPKDAGKLSVDRSTVFLVQQSFDHYTKNRGLASAGVCGITVGEFSEQALDCVSDPLPADPPIDENPAHSYADYNCHKPSKYKNIAKRLKRAAIARGWVLGPHS